ncbi:penicillin-binding transpeptidase domain-containing protein [Streptomyces sp. HNM0574]|uniref:penicillin-binding transpeptidase domain-containing protein n=1 Tax=Streptomyces sp. HNM0574 TaxID=2714954 RepID=UPI00146C26FB|nr:penicillin-binding transpeptidase domain-containing protein [Streptomyces sp. HNM0574]NLU67464.1 penicillin-binding protein 2 [Streptomyces sp. HNM0574]
MNRTIRRSSVVILLFVFALLLRITWIQVSQGTALAEDDDNRRNTIEQYGYPFGDIIVGGKPVTGSQRVDSGDFTYKRTYTDGELYSAVTGYGSHRGTTQLEGIYQDVLNGSDDRLKNPLDLLTGEHTKPGNVVTTIDPKVQKAGYEALGDKKGAAVAIDPDSGAILGAVSTPSYDPARIAGSGEKDQKAWKELNEDEDQPMINRALRQPVPPGSTFKLVVAAAALEDGLYSSVDERTDSPNPYTLKGTATKLENENKAAPCEDASIRTGLRYSCNNVFAKMATDLGKDKVRAQAEKFGFNDKEQDVPVRAATSLFPKEMDEAQTGLSGVGQFEVTATPLQIAMVSQAIAEGGELVDPHMVSEVQDGNGDAVEETGDPGRHRVMSEDTATQLKSAMQTVVETGTGTNAQIPGMKVGGKTGTAQHGVDNSGKPYAWFTSYAENSAGKKVAVAVVVEDSDAERAEVSGNGLAAPIAQRMMEAGLAG